MTKTTLAIIGNAETKTLFDWTRIDCDTVVFNEAANTAFKGKPVTMVLQLHDPVIWKNPNNRNDPTHFEWLKSTGVKVLMWDKYPEIPASEKFPRDAVINQIYNGRIMRSETEFDPICEVSCSPAWAVAYGIYMGYKRIEVYGVALSSNTEYSYQQGNFKFWLGVAIGRGIDVFFAGDMFDNPQYGYEGEIEIPYEDFSKRIAVLTPERDEAETEYKAAWHTMKKCIDGFIKEDNSKELFPALQELLNAGGKLGNVEGAKQANEYYQNKADAMLKTSERFIFSRQEFEHNARMAQNKAVEAQAQFNGFGGQLNLLHNLVFTAPKSSPKRQRAAENYAATVKQYIDAHNEIAGWTGAANENLRYMTRLDAGLKAAGGVKSEQAYMEQMKG